MLTVQWHAMDLSRMGGSRLRWFVLCLLACLAIVEFSVRGPLRALGKDGRNFNDFVSPYEQTRAWISGQDPYAPIVLKNLGRPLSARTLWLRKAQMELWRRSVAYRPRIRSRLFRCFCL